MRRGHVFLIGFMGSGKTTVGALLGPALSLPFIDLDARIVRAAGRSIASIFAAEGEACFRNLEARVLEEVLDSPPAVLSLGGGAFLPPGNRSRIKERGTCVWLAVSLGEALVRCRGELGRPLALAPLEFAKLYRQRQPIYRECDMKVETDGKSPRTICREIVVRLEERADTPGMDPEPESGS